MGWFALAALAAAVLMLMLVMRLPRALTGFVGATIMLGATGYALQGRPTLAASPATPPAVEATGDEELVELRQQLFGRFQYADSYFFIADALARSGDERGAARAMLGGVRSAPDNLPLWTGLGYRAAGADGAMSPVSRMAFRHARQLNPEHPGPYFFEGLAYVRTGDLNAARPLWQRALALSPAEAPWREGIATRLALLDGFIAMQREAEAAAPR
ncbi:tetratricopeptide repeat protein [Sphingomonas sp. IW22]|uniref:tetratricopeptide repeat protein n=1 Tax=Sphingomonas sp. IW22 TaxID=3242489 RepID=UPI0035214DEE